MTETREAPGVRGTLLGFFGATVLVTGGALLVFVLLDPRTLPWLSGQVGGFWSAVSGLFGR